MAIRQFKSNPSITDRSTTAMNKYLCDVNKRPLLSIDEEVELARTIRKGGIEGDKAKKKLIEGNLRFVISIANQYHCKDMELSDLISEGNIGLIKAAERFDDTKGFKFSTFAVWWIRQSIINAIAEHGRIVRVPLNQLATLRIYNQLAAETEQTEHRKPTAEEFADYADITLEKAKMLIALNNKAVSADSPIGGEDCDTTMVDMMSSDSHADSHVDMESLHNDIMTTMNHVLQPREREVIMRVFGLESPEESLEVIGHDMELSRERVRQVNELAKAKMHDNSELLYKYLG